MTPNLPTPRVTAAIPARAVGMAATANKRDAQIGRARSWLLGLTLSQPERAHDGRNRLPQFRVFFRFWDGFLSGFALFNEKTTVKNE
jgi:hypothetical protein